MAAVTTKEFFIGHTPRLHVKDWGGSGTPLLLVHGLAGNSHWWDQLAPKLAPRLRPIGLDLRGHGDSQWASDGRYGIDDFLSDIQMAKESLSLDRFLLAGHSMGARVCVAYAARACAGGAARQNPIDGLIAVDFMPESSTIRSRKFQRARLRPQPIYPSAERMVDHFRLEPPGTLMNSDQLRELALQCIRKNPEGYSWKFDWRVFQFRYPPVWPDLPQIDVPTLVVRGENSPTMSRDAFEKITSMIPRIHKSEIRHAYHHVPLDSPEDLAKIILEFAGSRTGRD